MLLLAPHLPAPMSYQSTPAQTYDTTNLHSYSQPAATDCQIEQTEIRQRGLFQPVTSINNDPVYSYSNVLLSLQHSVNNSYLTISRVITTRLRNHISTTDNY